MAPPWAQSVIEFSVIQLTNTERVITPHFCLGQKWGGLYPAVFMRVPNQTSSLQAEVVALMEP